MDSVLASVASHLGARVSVGEKLETTRPNQDAGTAFSQVCSKRVVAVRNHEWGEVGEPRDSSRGAEVLNSLDPKCSALQSFGRQAWTALCQHRHRRYLCLET